MFDRYKKSDFFLLTAVLISFLVSIGLWFSGYKDEVYTWAFGSHQF